MTARQALQLRKRVQNEIKMKAVSESKKAARAERERKLRLETQTFPDALEFTYEKVRECIRANYSYPYAVFYDSDGSSIYCAEELRKNGYTVEEKSKFVHAQNGDPDSGEGRCEDHVERYNLIWLSGRGK